MSSAMSSSPVSSSTPAGETPIGVSPTTAGVTPTPTSSAEVSGASPTKGPMTRVTSVAESRLAPLTSALRSSVPSSGAALDRTSNFTGAAARRADAGVELAHRELSSPEASRVREAIWGLLSAICALIMFYVRRMLSFAEGRLGVHSAEASDAARLANVIAAATDSGLNRIGPDGKAKAFVGRAASSLGRGADKIARYRGDGHQWFVPAAEWVAVVCKKVAVATPAERDAPVGENVNTPAFSPFPSDGNASGMNTRPKAE